jgi:hypothetical protein
MGGSNMSKKGIRKARKIRKEQFANDPESPQQLSLIADEIEARIKGTKKEIYKIGELLVQAREIVGHGKFKKWIAKRFDDLSYQTALHWMRVYNCCLVDPSIMDTMGISVLYQMAAPDFPKVLKEYLFDHRDQLGKIKNKDMRKIVKDFKSGKLTLKSPEIKKLVKFNRNIGKCNNYTKKVTKCIDQIKKLKDVVLSTTNKFQWPVHPKEKEIILSKDQWNETNDIITKITNAVTDLLPEQSDTKIRPKLELVAGNKR